MDHEGMGVRVGGEIISVDWLMGKFTEKFGF